MGWRLWYLSVFNMGGLLFVFDVMGIVFYGWVRVAFPSFRCVFSLLCFDWQVFMPSLLRCYAWITTCDESDMGASACAGVGSSMDELVEGAPVPLVRVQLRHEWLLGWVLSGESGGLTEAPAKLVAVDGHEGSTQVLTSALSRGPCPSGHDGGGLLSRVVAASRCIHIALGGCGPVFGQ